MRLNNTSRALVAIGLLMTLTIFASAATIPAGTRVTVRMGQSLSSESAQPGKIQSFRDNAFARECGVAVNYDRKDLVFVVLHSGMHRFLMRARDSLQHGVDELEMARVRRKEHPHLLP